MRLPAGEKDKRSVREYLRALGQREGPDGAKARARLEGPEVPDPLVYLWGWFLALDGMRTYGFSAPNPLTAEGIRAADALFGWGLEPMEVDALRMLDGAVRYPDAGEDEETDTEPVVEPAWPTKKG